MYFAELALSEWFDVVVTRFLLARILKNMIPTSRGWDLREEMAVRILGLLPQILVAELAAVVLVVDS